MQTLFIDEGLMIACSQFTASLYMLLCRKGFLESLCISSLPLPPFPPLNPLVQLFAISKSFLLGAAGGAGVVLRAELNTGVILQ